VQELDSVTKAIKMPSPGYWPKERRNYDFEKVIREKMGKGLCRNCYLKEPRKETAFNNNQQKTRQLGETDFLVKRKMLFYICYLYCSFHVNHLKHSGNYIYHLL
jgi:hypothetical protein